VGFRLIAMRAEPTHADPAAGPHAFDAPLFAELIAIQVSLPKIGRLSANRLEV
jgi:hypothetical protein